MKDRVLQVNNRQRDVRIDLKFFKKILRRITERLELESFSIAIHLVSAEEMLRINTHFLNHPHSTDVITFDYSSGYETDPDTQWSGEIFISVKEAKVQGAQFNSSWQEEVIRYVIHGFLHLLKYEDGEPTARRIMKRRENRLVQEMAAEFQLSQISRDV